MALLDAPAEGRPSVVELRARMLGGTSHRERRGGARRGRARRRVVHLDTHRGGGATFVGTHADAKRLLRWWASTLNARRVFEPHRPRGGCIKNYKPFDSSDSEDEEFEWDDEDKHDEDDNEDDEEGTADEVDLTATTPARPRAGVARPNARDTRQLLLEGGGAVAKELRRWTNRARLPVAKPGDMPPGYF